MSGRWTDDLKVGDYVGRRTGGRPADRYELVQVTRITPTRLIGIGGRRYLPDGSEQGGYSREPELVPADRVPALNAELDEGPRRRALRTRLHDAVDPSGRCRISEDRRLTLYTELEALFARLEIP
mgnify:FL=1